MSETSQSQRGTTARRVDKKAKAKTSKAKTVGNGVRTGDGWQAEKSALTRKAILEGAVRCFVREGYTKTTTAMIHVYFQIYTIL